MERLTPKTEKILAERFGKDSLLSLATVENGVPYVRTVNAYYAGKAFYVVTHALSNKMRHIQQNPTVALSGEWFTAHGTGASLGWFGAAGNAELAAKLRAVFAGWLDNGHTNLADENTCILRVRLTDGVLFSQGARYDIDFTA